MAKLKELTPEIRAEFEKWTGTKLGNEIKGEKNKFEVIKPDGTISSIHITNIPARIEHHKNLKNGNMTFSNLTQLFKDPIKKPKTKWCIASCGLAEEDYSKLKELAKKYNQTVNQFIKTLLLKVIESNK